LLGRSRSDGCDGQAGVKLQLALDQVDEEEAFNICQRYGTVIFDVRPASQHSELSIRESTPLEPGVEAAFSRPWKDTALLVGEGWTPEQVRSIATRIVGEVFQLPSLVAFHQRFPWLCTSGEVGHQAAERLPVLPNLIVEGLYLGHQGHALSLGRWRHLVGVSHVVNLAENRVPSAEDGVVYLSSRSNTRLSDVAGEGASFSQLADELLPEVDAVIGDGAKGRPSSGAVLVHCQQGRSRSCALVVGFLMRHRGHTLKDALTRVARRRPEMEVNEDYMRALMAWEAQPSCTLDELLKDHPRWIRRCGVARDYQDRPPEPLVAPCVRLWERTWDEDMHIAEASPSDCAPGFLGGPCFGRASANDRLAIARWSGYGETLLELMAELRTDRVMDGLFLGPMADAAYLPFLRHIGATHIVNCAAEVQPPPYADAGFFSYCCLPWRDSAEQGRVIQKAGFSELQNATKFIHEARSSGGVVLVHCVQGISRSASVVAAYLQEYEGMELEAVVAALRQAHLGALRPFPFQEMLRAFHYHLRAAQ